MKVSTPRFLGLVSLLLATGIAIAADGLGDPWQADNAPVSARIFSDVPAHVDPAAHYVFYVHGKIIESEGRHAVSPDFGPYEYDAILQAFASKGFVVISEVRVGDAGLPFVHKTVAEVRRLLAAGVPPKNVSVVGASKGGYLTLEIAAELGLPQLSYVILAGCGTYSEPLAPRLGGRILSIFDSIDRNSPSCQGTFQKATKLGEHREIVLKLGLDHGLLYQPHEEWLGPASAWAWPR
jgi:hypothetical protein